MILFEGGGTEDGLSQAERTWLGETKEEGSAQISVTAQLVNQIGPGRTGSCVVAGMV